MKDNASRNGSFINNHRLIKDFKESQETQLFTNDIIRWLIKIRSRLQTWCYHRFGAQVRDDATVLEKCIIAKLKILNDRGTDVGQRPDTDRLVSTYYDKYCHCFNFSFSGKFIIKKRTELNVNFRKTFNALASLSRVTQIISIINFQLFHYNKFL